MYLVLSGSSQKPFQYCNIPPPMDFFLFLEGEKQMKTGTSSDEEEKSHEAKKNQWRGLNVLT